MVASALIIAVSLVLHLYWFRYTCLLLLDGSPASQQADRVARANRLRFPEVQEALNTAPAAAGLDALHRSLDSDYRILVYLLQHSTAVEIPAMEEHFLVMDYRVMQFWYRVVRRFSETRATQALLEMSRVLGYFSQKMGERSAHAAA
jgi:hypothetical protein